MVKAAADDARGELIVSRDPATLEKLGELTTHTAAEVASAVDRARQAQPAWARVDAAARARVLRRARDYLIDHQDRLATLISRESGKPLQEALSADIFPVIYLIDYFCSHAPKMLADEPIDLRMWKLLGRSSKIERVPRGVVAVVSPWNYPFNIPAGEVCMALLAGNAVVLKPSRAAALVGEAIGEVFNAAGLPHGLMQVVQGSGSALLSQRLDFVAFTGSVGVGKKVMAAAAEHLTPVMLELGGKCPAVVCRDANLEVAASGIVWGAFTNAGQACASVERVYVHRAVADEFLDRVVSKTRALRQGIGLQHDVDIGPLCTEEQFVLTQQHVDDARTRGAQIVTGGEPNPAAGPGYFYKPTVMTHVEQSWPCMQEETFGPTMPVRVVDDEAEAVALCNDTRFGLTAGVWTSSLRRGRTLARQILAGTVYVNEALISQALAETPWGGFKESGIGRTHGKCGLHDFTAIRHIHTNARSGMKNPWVFPYSQQGYETFKATGQLLRSGLGAKVRGGRRGLPGALRVLFSRS